MEQVADADEHLPVRAGEIHERQRLADLHIEPRGDHRAERSGGGAGVAVADAVQRDDMRLGDRHERVDRRGHVLHALVLPDPSAWHEPESLRGAVQALPEQYFAALVAKNQIDGYQRRGVDDAEELFGFQHDGLWNGAV